MKKTRRHLSFANLTSLLALFVALGGTVYAAATIGPSDIKRNAVRAKHIKANNVKRPDIAANAINAAKIAANAVNAAEIAANAVGASELQDASVTAAKLNTPPQWVNVPLATGWTTFSGVNPPNFHFGPVQCYKDPFGIVHLRGAAETSDVNPGVVGTLPAACRVIQETATPTANEYAEFPIVRLDTDGFGDGGVAGYVGWDPTVNSQNSLGEDDGAAFTPGEGVSFDGVAIGAR